MPERLRSFLLFVPIFLLAAALRLPAPALDAPPRITGGPSPNEGLYLLNARHKAETGEWQLDDWNSELLHPVGSAAAAAVFESFGPSLEAGRRLSALLSLAGIALFYLVMRRAGGAGTALLATFFLATSGLHVVIGRQAGPAPMGMVLMLATILLWELGRTRLLFAALAGVMLVLGAVIENGAHDLFFLLAALLATFMVRLQAWKMPWTGATRRRIRTFWIAAILTFLAWGLLFVRPHGSAFIRMLSTPLADARLGNVAQNLFMAPFNFWDLIRWTPALVLISLLYFLVFARELFAPIARHRPLAEARVWIFAWLVAAPLYFGMRSDRPLGVLVLMIPPLCAAGAEALVSILALTQVRKPRLDIMVVLLLFTVAIWTGVQIAVHSAVTLGYRQLPHAFFIHQFRYEFLIVALIATPLSIVVSRLWLSWKQYAPVVSPVVALALFIGGITGVLATDVVAARAVFASRADVVAAGKALRSIPKNAVMAGSWAPALSLDGGWRGIVVWPGMNDDDPVGRFAPTHLALQRGSREWPRVNEAFGAAAPDVLTRMRTIGEWPIGGGTIEVYALGADSAGTAVDR